MDDLARQQLTGLVIFLLLVVVFLSAYLDYKFSDEYYKNYNYNPKKAKFYLLLGYIAFVMIFITIPGIWWSKI